MNSKCTDISYTCQMLVLIRTINENYNYSEELSIFTKNNQRQRQYQNVMLHDLETN